MVLQILAHPRQGMDRRDTMALQQIGIGQDRIRQICNGVEARIQAMDQEGTAEVKLNPTYDEFQRQRDVIRRLQEEDESPQT